MFNKNLKEKVRQLELRVGQLEGTVKRITCDHSESSFVLSSTSHISLSPVRYVEICDKCNKHLGVLTQDEVLERKLEKAKEEVKSLSGELKKYTKQKKPDYTTRISKEWFSKKGEIE